MEPSPAITSASPPIEPGLDTTKAHQVRSIPIDCGAIGARILADMGATKILVVDDNEDAADMLAAVLELRGYELRVAHNPQQALEIARSWQPDVAFLDLGLPEMDGCELATQMRVLPGLSQLRMIALTGYGQAADRERTKLAGFTQHLVKPVEIRMLEAALIAP